MGVGCGGKETKEKRRAQPSSWVTTKFEVPENKHWRKNRFGKKDNLL